MGSKVDVFAFGESARDGLHQHWCTFEDVDLVVQLRVFLGCQVVSTIDVDWVANDREVKYWFGFRWSSLQELKGVA